MPRDTKDIDIFVKPEDCPRVLEAFERLGYQTEIPFPHWLGKIHAGEHFMDVIFNSGNGVARVDDLWFDHAPRTNVLGVIVRLSPAEEMIWSKAFIQERERFDGADVLHLLRETGPSLDWPRLLMRFGDYWRVLLSHLILFGFVYPDKRRERAGVGDGRADAPAQRQPAEPPERRLLRHAALARAVPARPRSLEVPRRAPAARGPDDPRADRDLDRRDRKQEVESESDG